MNTFEVERGKKNTTLRMYNSIDEGIRLQMDEMRRLMEIMCKLVNVRTKEEKDCVREYVFDHGKLLVVKNISSEERRLFVVRNVMSKSLLAFNIISEHFFTERTVNQ